MKIFLTIAATLAAFASASAVSAKDAANGHYEWQYSPHPGPNKSHLPDYKRVWIKDASTIANCDCAMMQDSATATDCMAMPHKGASPSNG